jgi:hypothetical protein
MRQIIQCNSTAGFRWSVGMAAIMLLLHSNPLFAQLMTLPVDLSYLSQRADIIIQGKVLSVRNENLPGSSNFPTVSVTLEVENMLRGPSATTFTFREAVFGFKPRTGKRNYQIGQRLILFLPSASSLGLSSPIGIEQGRFHIARNAAGAEMIVNEAGNAGLFKNVAQKVAGAGKKLTPDQMRVAATERGPVRLDGFTSLTKSLILLPRIK